MSFIQKLKQKFVKTSNVITSSITNIFNNRKLDNDALDEFEEMLIKSDMGVEIAMQFTEKLRKNKFNKEMQVLDAQQFLIKEITDVLEKVSVPMNLDKYESKTKVIVFCGVNGNGKTTTAGKLAAQLQNEGKKVALGACDTFRAAAVEQLQMWGEKLNIPVFTGANDPAAVAYKALESCKEENIDILILDTAGRLHNKNNLMEELQKCVRVLKKLDNNTPHEIIMVVDSTTGQNAYAQIEAFKAAVPITGLIFTKLDSSAKGGVIVGVAQKYDIPIFAIGVGEGIEDLLSFNKEEFAASLVGEPQIK